MSNTKLTFSYPCTRTWWLSNFLQKLGIMCNLHIWITYLHGKAIKICTVLFETVTQPFVVKTQTKIKDVDNNVIKIVN